MSNWNIHNRKPIPAMMRKYVPGEDLTGVSVGDDDKANGSPTEGDMIARDPINPSDMWLVNAAYFADNFYPDPVIDD